MDMDCFRMAPTDAYHAVNSSTSPCIPRLSSVGSNVRYSSVRCFEVVGAKEANVLRRAQHVNALCFEQSSTRLLCDSRDG